MSRTKEEDTEPEVSVKSRINWPSGGCGDIVNCKSSQVDITYMVTCILDEHHISSYLLKNLLQQCYGYSVPLVLTLAMLT